MTQYIINVSRVLSIVCIDISLVDVWLCGILLLLVLKALCCCCMH